jgi:cysteinyl-tRNA synthetase
MPAAIDKAREAFRRRSDDLNTRAALAAIFDLVRDVNAAIDAKQSAADAERWQRDRRVRSRARRRDAARAEDAQPPVPVEEIERLIESARPRGSARLSPPPTHPQRLAERGILLEDNPGGTRWKRK